MNSLFDECDLSDSTAEFSPCRTWRYTLTREWEDGERVAFLMFNPSTADETLDDHTICKCRGFAKNWGYGSMVIVNLFAIRGTDPRIVRSVQDPVGPMNNYHIVKAIEGCREIVCAWGCGGHMKGETAKRPAAVMDLLERERFGMPVTCLGYSADGSPRHPLMLAYSTPRIQYHLPRSSV